LRLEGTVFNQPAVASSIETRFVPVKLNADQSQATAQAFGITQVPTDVVITPQGQVVGKLNCPGSPTAYVSELIQVANRFDSRSGGSFDQAVANAPAASQLNQAYAGLNIGTPAPTSAATPPTVSQPQVAVVAPPVGDRYAQAAAASSMNPAYQQAGTQAVSSVAPQSPEMGDRYASAAVQPRQSAPQTAPAQVMNQYANAPQQAAPAANMASPPITPIQAPASDVAATAGQVAPSAANPGTASMTAMPPAHPQLPPGSPPLAFDGYCPVSMKKHWRWLPGNAQFGAVHRGRTYLFQGQAEQQEFLANPDFYSPALSGQDPVLAVDQSQSVAGRREHSLEYNGQFYLFSSEATLQQFSGNPQRYDAGVRQAMGLTPGGPVRR
jgi:protein disulfide-isomerase